VFLFSPGVKQQGHEINHSSLFIAVAQNEWSYASTTPVCIHGMDGTPLFFTNILKEPAASIFRVGIIL
jgi:hypothetical protein